ncbi:MAG: 2'-5' RNA ligase family protein [Clostridiales bacterium]|nr:2'-5' RNA ligase family protein [Clostridiales bacterium]
MKEKKLYLLAVLDKESQERLAGYYDVLRQNGFTGKQTKNIPYHFTLGMKDPVCEKQLIEDLDRICADTSCIDIHLSNIGLFGLNVLFIAPAMNFELLTLQQKFFPTCGNGAHNWIAHATLLIDEPEKIQKALPIAAENFRPFIGRIESIALYEFFPMRFIKECPLKKNRGRELIQ